METERRATDRLYIWGTSIVFSCFLFYWLLLVFTQGLNPGDEENNVVYFIQRLLDGSGLYREPESPAYPIAKYTPGYYLLVYSIADLLNINGDNLRQLIILNRCISLFLLLFTCATISLIARKVFDFSLKNVLILFAVAFIFMDLSAIVRPGNLSQALYFLSLLFFLSGLKPNALAGRRIIYFSISGLISCLAVFSWQFEITIPLFSCLWLLLAKRYKACAVYFISFLITLLLVLLIIEYTDGVYMFIQNILPVPGIGADLRSFFEYISSDKFGMYGWLGIAMMTVLLSFYSNTLPITHRFLIFLIFLQFIASCLFSLQSDSSSDYFTNWWLLVLLGIAVFRTQVSSFFYSIAPRLGLMLFMTILAMRLSVIIYPACKHILSEYRAQGGIKIESEKQLARYAQELPAFPLGVYREEVLIDEYPILSNK